MPFTESMAFMADVTHAKGRPSAQRPTPSGADPGGVTGPRGAGPDQLLDTPANLAA